MRLLRRPGLLVAIAVALVALPTVASGAPSSPTAPIAVSANSTTYQDSSGENPAAPDITTITVSNTDAGMLSFRINIPNRQGAALPQDMLVGIFIDSDNNTATGDTEPIFQGADYAIEVFGGEAALFRWDGTGHTRRPGDPPATSLLFSYQNGVTVTISKSELGNTQALRFNVLVYSGIAVDPVTREPNFDAVVADIAPAAGAGLYPYEVKITPPTLVVKSLRPTPKNPTAGRPFTLRLVAARSDTGAAVQNGRVTCIGRVGNARLKAQVQRVQGGAATCTWNIPLAATAKTFRGSVAIVFEGLKVQQAYSGKVR